MTVRRLLTVLVLAVVVTGVRARTAGENSGDSVKWYNTVQRLREVTVKTSRKRYSRKNNPAVELMKKVIAAKRRTKLSNRDYYSYSKYQKLTLATNDVSPEELTTGLLSKIPDVFKQVELCPYNQKLILPVMVTETVQRHIYRRQPHCERDITLGERADGINTMFSSGDLIVTALKDFFTDVDIYDDQIRLLQHPFTSPISRDAIGFYRFYIVDTLDVSGDRCIHLSFLPNNQQDFGFSGDMYVLDDSSYQVKRCELTIPERSDVNFVGGMRILQEFEKLPGGDWVLANDDMVVELKLYDFMQKAVVIRNTRIGGHAFDEIADDEFRLKNQAETERKATLRDDWFWAKNRRVELTRGEYNIDEFMDNMERMGGSKMVIALLRLLVDNYVETGPRRGQSRVDIGPVMSTVSTNHVDGLRTRIGGQTTALLSPHLFFNGYYAHGWKSGRDYYKAEATWSLNSKKYLPREFPMRNITFTSTYDVCTPTDKFLSNDKDNVFTSLRWTTVDKMMTYNRQQLKVEREELCGLRSTVTLTAEENEACGNMLFATTADYPSQRSLRTTELRAELRYAPGEKFVSTKQHRRMINLDAPVLTVSHAVGFDGLLGGQYRYNLTEMSFFKRMWMKSWGKIDVSLSAGAQWNRVPFPLLIMPAANLSYVVQKDMFSLMNNMEFLNDRYASVHLSWDVNGKLFNRIPFVRRLKWREYIGVKALWGTLTDKNNPALAQNAGSTVLMPFPDGSYVMDGGKPYVEVLVGVHNVFRFFHVEYVRRLTYLNLPTATKHGVRFKFSVKF